MEDKLASYYCRLHFLPFTLLTVSTHWSGTAVQPCNMVQHRTVTSVFCIVLCLQLLSSVPATSGCTRRCGTLLRTLSAACSTTSLDSSVWSSLLHQGSLGLVFRSQHSNITCIFIAGCQVDSSLPNFTIWCRGECGPPKLNFTKLQSTNAVSIAQFVINF